MQADVENVLPLARKDLACYAIALHPGFELAPHHRFTIGKLEAVERGKIRRLIFAEPPQHGKSLTTSELFPAWYLGRHPDHSVICSTYGQDLSSDFGRKVRNTGQRRAAPGRVPSLPTGQRFSRTATIRHNGGRKLFCGWQGRNDHGPRREPAHNRRSAERSRGSSLANHPTRPA
jgi:Terminase large subunit, T4likevirus-type, N-terminal